MRVSSGLIAGVAAALLAGAALTYEFVRERPAEADPVASPPPTRPDETARLEGGFSWRATEAGRALFDLAATTLVGIEAGIHLIEQVDNLQIYLEDGRAVTITARRGRIEPGGRHEENPRIVLEKDVRVRDPEGLEMRTERLVYSSSERTLWAEGPVRLDGPDVGGTFGGLTYRPDARLLELSRSVDAHIGDGGGWQIESGSLDYRMETGEVLFKGPMRSRRAGFTLLAGEATVTPGEGADSPLTFEGGGPCLLSGMRDDLAWQLASRRLEAVIGGMPRQLLSVDAGTPASLVTHRQTPEGLERTTVDAERWQVTPLGEGGWKAQAGPSFTAVRQPATGSPWSLEGRWLHLERTTSGGLRLMNAEEDVQVTLGERIRLVSDRLNWTAAAPGRVLLSGTPAQAWQGKDVIEAPRLVLLRSERELIAEGGATADLASLQGAGLFGAREPVRVRSERVFVPESDRPVLFDGRAQAWQGSSMLRSGLIRVDRNGTWLIAERDVVLRVGRDEQTDIGETSRLMGDRFEYSSTARKARLVGNASYSAGQRRIRAQRMDIDIDGEGEVSALRAEGEVRIALAGATGSGDVMEWEGGEQGIILLTGRSAPAQLRSPGSDGEPRVLEAARIRYDLATGAVSTESGAGRSRVRTKPDEAETVPEDP
jgi:LPS export ABC transporter protein LptC